MKPKITLEVCVASVADAVQAQAGGADRLELNLALELGGLTPTAGLLQEVKRAVDVPVIVMIRPRAAGFCYSPTESRLMMRDAELLLGWGADGVAAGALLPDGTVDLRFWHEFGRLAQDRQVVFHRAFDLLAQPDDALEQLIDCGTTRVLTAGGCPTAREGRHQIAHLRKRAGNRIEILAGGGVSADHAVELIRDTGCDQVHGSFRVNEQDPAGCIAAGTYPRTCQTRVAETRAALDLA